MHLPVHAMSTTKSAAEQCTCYLPLIEFCADQHDKQFCDNTDKSGHMEYGERFGNGATRLCSAACCIAWGPERKRNGLLGLLYCAYGNIQIHAFDAWFEWLRIAHTINTVQASGGKIHDSKCEIVIRKSWSRSCKLIAALLCFDILRAVIWPGLVNLGALDGPPFFGH